MSDWSGEIQGYEERNYEALAEGFIADNNEAWNDFVAARFFGCGLCERMGINEDGGMER